MAWSTRELAQIAGTTVKAVRHYHEVGLLDEPERSSNGYKQYEVRHLIRVLQIRRLSELGLSLTQISTLQSTEENPREALRAIDAELATTIDRLQSVRTEIAALLEHGSPAVLPRSFGAAAHGMTETDRSLIMIYSRILSDDAMRDMSEIFTADRSDADREFETLSPHADLATRVRLAAQLAPELGAQYAKYPWLSDPATQSTDRSALLHDQDAVVQLYNLAQLEVLYRAHLLASGQTDERLPMQ
ncbi:MerR family transcriptional regulator [Agromyces laixinhei]|uniref:MerR family transcriptional regulator n=1 Tax=Agromyces laixinhei TaxID=2585717 RepID=UPI0012ED5C6E|nr:MerR family transcriptional regulator [Agromyces laixinhei]